jgi:predicted tellurium resistance membrane protein TerC
MVPWHPIIALATVACLFITVAQHSDRWGVLAGAPQLMVLALSVWEVGGLIVVYLAPALAAVGGADANPAVLAALRTAVLSAASVSLALSSRFKRWPEARWLVYPVLVLVGIKLLLEDFPNGQPASLFVALALVGSALLLVAKLLTRDKLDHPTS